MKFKKPKNENYAATIVVIKNVIELEGCDNIQGTIIFGNHVIIGKDVSVGNKGVFFPAETQLSHEYAYENNLYRHAELNKDKEKKGYIEDNRRIRTMKLRGNKSCGLFMPLSSLATFLDKYQLIEEGDTFDEINTIPICNKYIVKKKNSQGQNKKKKAKKISKLLDNQFRFHQDTSNLGKNAHKFKSDDLISITYKIHGTSTISSKILCKKKINWFYKLLRFFKVKIVDFEYDNIYSSRKVIKNDDMNEGKNSFYNVDIWGLANKVLNEYLLDGMTIYAEIVGYLPTGAYIQKPFDYGCKDNTFEVYIYRITYTNSSGNVFEFSWKQLKDWCNDRGLKHVPELFYGPVRDVLRYGDKFESLADDLIESLRDEYLEQDCWMCKNKVPAEGIVIRKECNDFEAYKFKSFKFLEFETKKLDKGESDIEEEN